MFASLILAHTLEIQEATVPWPRLAQASGHSYIWAAHSPSLQALTLLQALQCRLLSSLARQLPQQPCGGEGSVFTQDTRRGINVSEKEKVQRTETDVPFRAQKELSAP